MNKRYLLFFFLLISVVLNASAQSRDKSLTITVTATSDDNLEGQEVSLTQTDYSLSYGTVTLDAQGKCTIMVYAGNHNLVVERPGYEVATKDFYVPENGTGATVEVTLTEKVRNPFAVSATLTHDAYTGKNSALMTWNTEAPVFFDNFEDYAPFAVDFGEWTGIDADLEAAAPIVGDYPNRCVMQYAQIINPLAVEPAWWYDYPILRPYSGKQYVGFTRTNSGKANDDWLISPSITVGTDNVLAFMGKAADQFPEKFQVYVTTKTDNPAQSDFVRLDADNYETADFKGWKKYQYDISQYAGQTVKFAIRYISEYNNGGSFMLMIDDFYVGQAKGYDAAMAKGLRVRRPSMDNPNEVFHISKNGIEVGTTEEYSYTFEDLQPGTYTLGVKAVYRAAESEMVTTSLVVPAEGYSKVVFNVTADSKLSTDGQTVNLISTATSQSYTLTVNEGKAEIASLPNGEYVVNVAEGAFEAYQNTINVAGDSNYDIVLSDRVITPYNITADINGTGDGLSDVSLKWNQNLEFNDSFEEYEDFATGSFGDWISLDLDQRPVYPIGLGSSSNIVYFPGAGTADAPAAIAPIVFNPWNTVPAMLPTDPAVAAPTGDKTIVFFSPQQARANKWLISPEIEIRDNYVLTTTLKAYAEMYPESLEFCVAENSTEPVDFTVVSTVDNISGGEWAKYETDLSDYVGKTIRIGVHYTSYDAFFAQLDDFIVGPAEGDVSFIEYGNVIRYDIYVDGVKVGESTEPSYVITGLSAGSHTIGIKAIYKNGESEMAEYTINITKVGDVEVFGTNAKSGIYNLSGQYVGESLSALPTGIYFVKSGTQFKKIRK